MRHQFPPVTYDAERSPFGTPQYLPPLSQSLPGVKQRSSYPGAGGIAEVRSDHCYAAVLDLNFNVDATSIKVLDQPTGKRNLLMMRNTSTTQTIFIGFGKDATSVSTLAIAAGQILLFDIVVPQDDVYALASAAGGTLSIAYSTIADV